jgi:hypothetical protein
MPAIKPNYIAIVFLVVFLCGLVLYMNRQMSFVEFKKDVQMQSVPTGMLQYGAMGDILRKLGVIKYTPNDFERFDKTDHSEEVLENVTFQKKRRVDDYLFSVSPRPRGKVEYKSSEIAKSLEHKEGWPILSIVISERDLNDPEIGLMPKRAEKGREWEKIAEISYMEKGEILFETYAGIRTHGGERLISKKWKPGFKLYFRGDYGLENVPDGLILQNQVVPIKTLVLQTTVWPPGYPMNNVLACDISRQIGCEVPSTRLIEVYINGISYGMTVAVEHVSRRQWGQRYGHEEYSMFKFRSDNRDIDKKMYNQHFWKPTTAKENFSKDYAAEHIDLDNFSRHVFSWVFNGTEDFCQGVAVFNHLDPEGRVSWINWDMDHSYYDRSAELNGFEREIYKQKAFQIIYLDRHSCGRTELFSKLMRRSPEYKQEFVNLVVFLLNHRLNKDFLQERLGYYSEMMASFGKPHHDYVTMLTKFMKHRTKFIYQDMVEQFELKGPTSCLVKIDGLPIEVDGVLYKESFTGHYFNSTPVELKVPDRYSSKFGHWLVNGEKMAKTVINLSLTSDTIVRIVPRI